MTRYIEWGDYGVSASGYIQRDRSDSTLVDPADPESLRALWAALPPDLRLALAKTAPKVAGRWHDGKRVVAARYYGDGKAAAVVERSRNTLLPFRAKTLLSDTGHATKELAQAACDAALLAQGYVLDNGDAP